MSIFKNISSNTIHLVINGKRISIRPGEQINGPHSLVSNPSLKLISSDKPIQLTPVILNNNMISLMPHISQSTTKSYQITNSISNFKSIIDDEIKHLEFYKDNSSPSVTIAILTKNSLNLIKDCCESIFEKVKYNNITILIADTGTTESQVLDYYKTVESTCITKNWKYKQVNMDFYHYGKNYNNVVLNHVDTDFVLIQNNDTKAINDYATEMMKVAILNKVGSVGCRMYYPNNTIQHDGQTFYNATGNNLGGATHINLAKEKSSIKENEIHLVDGNTAAGCLLKTSYFKQIDGFDETYKDIFQDVDLMAKIPHILNKFNYCNRKAEIYHIDNASRKKIGLNHDNINHDVAYIQTKFIQNGMNTLKEPKKVDFSIITLVRDLNLYKEFLNSIQDQIGSHTIELIAIPNFNNTFESAYEGLNIGRNVSSGDILIYCHEDIEVSKTWFNDIKSTINKLSVNNKIGVLGMAGVSTVNTQAFYLNGSLYNHLPEFVECQSLDELCLITLKENNFKFMEDRFNGFHFYGADLCFNASLKGFKNFAFRSITTHKSDGSKNLNTSSKYDAFKKCATDFNIYAINKKLMNWRTTTARSINGILEVFPKG